MKTKELTKKGLVMLTMMFALVMNGLFATNIMPFLYSCEEAPSGQKTVEYIRQPCYQVKYPKGQSHCIRQE